MGNNRFRLSDMMPNAWFYKLRDMGEDEEPQRHHSFNEEKNKLQRQQQLWLNLSSRRPSRNTLTTPFFPDPPRRSSKQRELGKGPSGPPLLKLITSSVSAVCNCRATLRTKTNSPPDYSASLSDSSLDQGTDFSLSTFPPEFRSDCVLATDSFDKMLSWSSSNCDCKLDSNSYDDIVINVDEKYIARRSDDLDVFHKISDLDLPPIITKPPKFDDQVEDIRKKDTPEPVKFKRSSAKYEETNADASLSVKAYNTGRKSVSSTTSSSSRSRRSLSDSLAVVKSSFDPQKDFRGINDGDDSGEQISRHRRI
ncbi:hypothetical protein OIU78_001594 [Salix suchowensis]|nr:hypothetical protein OIU78_001594 [Salix suchowensis]